MTITDHTLTDPINWLDRFAGLSQLGFAERQTLVSRSQIVSLLSDTILFGPGQSPENMFLVLDGSVKVQQVSETGHEIVLYRVRAGQSCVLTTACLLGNDDFAAQGITETAVQAAAVPREVFDTLVAQSKHFRNFVFGTFSKRITDLFVTIDEVAFQRLDVRLADKLLALSGDEAAAMTTHQKLSVELGTAREVVSRQLQEFQRRGWIVQGRGRVDLIDREQLSRLAQHHV